MGIIEGQKQRAKCWYNRANLSKVYVCLISYSSYTGNQIQQYRIVKGIVAPPKCLYHVATHIEKDQYTLIEQSAYLILLKIGIY